MAKKKGFDLKDTATLIGFIIGILATWILGWILGLVILLLVIIIYMATNKNKVGNVLCEKYGLSEYTKERIEILSLSMDSLFNSDKIKKCKLSDFF